MVSGLVEEALLTPMARLLLQDFIGHIHIISMYDPWKCLCRFHGHPLVGYFELSGDSCIVFYLINCQRNYIINGMFT